MNIKKFQTLCKVLNLLFMTLTAICLMFFLLFLLAQILSNDSFSFIMNPTGTPLFTAVKNPPTETVLTQTGKILSGPLLLGASYLFWSSSRIFQDLAAGISPFTKYFSKKVRQIGVILVLADIFIPLIYSSILSLLMKNGYYFQLQISSWFVFGLILIVVADVLRYGIELQKLADETV